MEDVTIQYSNAEGAFYAGELLSGWILTAFDKNIKFDKIRLRIIGKGDVSWSETTGTGDDQKTNSYSASEQYLDVALDVFNIPGETTQNSRQPRLPFSHRLPSNIPCSFKTKSGKIEYKCEVKFVGSKVPKTIFGSKKKWILPFTVLPQLSLHLDPNAAVMVIKAKEKRLKSCVCCCPIPIGRISANITVDKDAFYLGEIITCKAELRNSTREHLHIFQIGIRKVTCKADGSKNTDEDNLLVKAQHPAVILPGQSYVWTNVIFTVTQNHLPTNLGSGCNIIDLNYCVELRVAPQDTCWCPRCDSLILQIPIVIGCRKNIDQIEDCGNQFSSPSLWPSADFPVTSQPRGFVL